MKLLVVCLGNICRSPTAEGVARHFIETGGLAGRIEVDSAGTQGYHVGEAPDPRAQKFAMQRGYDLSGLRARKLELRDFQEFDLLLAVGLAVAWARTPGPIRPLPALWKLGFALLVCAMLLLLLAIV